VIVLASPQSSLRIVAMVIYVYIVVYGEAISFRYVETEDMSWSSTDSEKTELGLDQHHQTELVQFLRFSRMLREQRLNVVNAVFDDVLKKQLNDQMMTREEVINLLRALQAVIRGEMESELINATHISLLLFRQLCGQAEKWHLKLCTNLSELEDRQLLDAVQVFEKRQLDTFVDTKTPDILRKLDIIASYEHGVELKTEMDRLRAENEQLKKREQIIVRQVVEKEDPKLAAELANTRNRMELLQHDNELDKLKAIELEDQLKSVRGRLEEVNEQLTMKETELEKKFAKTNAYLSMRQILNSKNKQIKEMRQKLKEAGVPVGDDDD